MTSTKWTVRRSRPMTHPRGRGTSLTITAQLLLELTALGSGHDGRPAMLANQTPQWTGTA